MICPPGQLCAVQCSTKHPEEQHSLKVWVKSDWGTLSKWASSFTAMGNIWQQISNIRIGQMILSTDLINIYNPSVYQYFSPLSSLFLIWKIFSVAQPWNRSLREGMEHPQSVWDLLDQGDLILEAVLLCKRTGVFQGSLSKCSSTVLSEQPRKLHNHIFLSMHTLRAGVKAAGDVLPVASHLSIEIDPVRCCALPLLWISELEHTGGIHSLILPSLFLALM